MKRRHLWLIIAIIFLVLAAYLFLKGLTGDPNNLIAAVMLATLAIERLDKAFPEKKEKGEG